MEIKLTDEEIEVARKKIEDVLIDYRDARIAVLRNNGLVCKERNGTPIRKEIIMKHYLYLLAWIDGSDSAGGEKTLIHKQEDLLPQYEDFNEHIFAIVIMDCPSENLAAMIGESKAFHNNYTAHDSFSIVVEVSEARIEFERCNIIRYKEI